MSEYDVKIVRSDRRTCAIQIDRDLTVVLRLPKNYPESRIPELLRQYDAWIKKHIEIMRLKNEARTEYELTDDDIKRLTELARRVIPEKVKHYSKIMGLTPTGVKITSAHSRFGSCSGKNSLCFSYILMRYPDEAIDYVVVHELAHIKHHNHSRSFYSLVGKYMPDYREREKLLRGTPEF
ncbi:MAG: M48 family metallopeptidase [Clostridiales bacterium]|nr:M48 family metallopeptidase [Clostridiales bacterium]